MDLLNQLTPDEIERLALLARISSMIRIIARAMRVPFKYMCAKSQRKELVQARYVAMFVVHQSIDAPLKEIGYMFGGRSHCMVLHGIRRVSSDPDLLSYAKRIQLKVCTI